MTIRPMTIGRQIRIARKAAAEWRQTAADYDDQGLTDEAAAARAKAIEQDAFAEQLEKDHPEKVI
jgi:hypothetical protein